MDPAPNQLIKTPSPELRLNPSSSTTSARFQKPLLAAGITLAISLLATFVVMRAWMLQPGIPMVYGKDSLIFEMWVKTMADTHGWYFKNPFLAAPGWLDMRDFPATDAFHFLLLRLFLWTGMDWGQTVNAFVFLTFALVPLATLYAFRQSGLSYPFAIFAAVLYNLQPYHFRRAIGGHFFLSMYLTVPLITMVTLWISRESDRFFHARTPEEPARFNYTGDRFLISAAICLLLGMANQYYPLFGCFLMLIAGAYAGLNNRTLLPIRVAGMLTFITCVSFAVNVAPTVIYILKDGPNPAAATRAAFESEVAGLKIAQLILPVTHHRFPILDRIKGEYNRAPLVNENDMATLGGIGSIGFLLLLAPFFLKRQHPWTETWHDVAVLNLSSVLLGTIGGFGAVLAVVVTPLIRSYNRIGIFIAWYALLLVGHLLQSAYRRFPRSAEERRQFMMLLGLLLILGILDQTSPDYAPEYTLSQATFKNDHQFFLRVEAAMPPGALVFQLPYVSFPEGTPAADGDEYHQLVPYLHTRAIHWSGGAMRGRAPSLWIEKAARFPPDELLPMIVEKGFTGLLLDRRGFRGQTIRLYAGLDQMLKTKPLLSKDDRYAFYDLRNWIASTNPRGAVLNRRAAATPPG